MSQKYLIIATSQLSLNKPGEGEVVSYFANQVDVNENVFEPFESKARPIDSYENGVAVIGILTGFLGRPNKENKYTFSDTVQGLIGGTPGNRIATIKLLLVKANEDGTVQKPRFAVGKAELEAIEEFNGVASVKIKSVDFMRP